MGLRNIIGQWGFIAGVQSQTGYHVYGIAFSQYVWSVTITGEVIPDANTATEVLVTSYSEGSTLNILKCYGHRLLLDGTHFGDLIWGRYVAIGC